MHHLNLRKPTSPKICQVFCSKRRMKYVTARQSQMCKSLRCVDYKSEEIGSVYFFDQHSQPGKQCNGNACFPQEEYELSLQSDIPVKATPSLHYRDADEITSGLEESDRILRHVYELMKRTGCNCRPCNSRCTQNKQVRIKVSKPKT